MPTEIDAVIAAVNKKAKREVLVRGADLRHQTFQRVTSGSLSIDLALGGGWPLNCPNEIIGLESMGKTVLAMQTVAANQGIDPKHHTVWGAAEELDPVWAAKNGIDLDRVTFVMTNIMEEMYDSILEVLEKRATDAVVLDSLPALMPELEDDKTMGEPVVGKGALLTNKFFRKLYSAQTRSLVEYDRPALLLVVNQWREMIGVMHGDPRTTPGGRGKNYAYMTRVEVTREEWLKDGDRQVGQVIKVRTIKNKTAPRWRTGQVDFYFDDSNEHEAGRYDTLRDVWAVAEDVGAVERKGAWYHFKQHKWNGKDAVWKAMQADPKLAQAIDTEVRRELGIPALPGTSGSSSRTKRKVPRR
jgi:recombination protein RecA